MTINQAAGQADPTNASPINFTVVFNEPSPASTGDVTLRHGRRHHRLRQRQRHHLQRRRQRHDQYGTVTAPSGPCCQPMPQETGTWPPLSTDNTVTYDAAPPVVSNVESTPNPTKRIDRRHRNSEE